MKHNWCDMMGDKLNNPRTGHDFLNYFLILAVPVIFTFTGCVSYKTVPYFQNIEGAEQSFPITISYTDPVIQKNDILKITASSLDPEVTRLFSFNSEVNNHPSNNSSGSHYLVDPGGFIRMPLIGQVKVEGFTTWQVRDTLTSMLAPYLKETVVEIRIASFRISVLGDVARPGVYTVQNERVTLPEALALAGDLNISAKRDNILLVRDEDGMRKYIRFNLGSSDMANSPYFYLRSNDLVYVQPGKIATRDINFRNLTYLATVVSLIALIATVIK